MADNRCVDPNCYGFDTNHFGVCRLAAERYQSQRWPELTGPQQVPYGTFHIEGIITAQHNAVIDGEPCTVVDAFEVKSVENLPPGVEAIIFPSRQQRPNETLEEYAKSCFVIKRETV
jgi:hypothetical protein